MSKTDNVPVGKSVWLPDSGDWVLTRDGEAIAIVFPQGTRWRAMTWDQSDGQSRLSAKRYPAAKAAQEAIEAGKGKPRRALAEAAEAVPAARAEAAPPRDEHLSATSLYAGNVKSKTPAKPAKIRAGDAGQSTQP